MTRIELERLRRESGVASINCRGRDGLTVDCRDTDKVDRVLAAARDLPDLVLVVDVNCR